MDCHDWIIELVENARTGLQPDAELQKHLRECSRCRERWEDERNLTAQFRTMRHTATAVRSSEARREEVMREFASAHLGAPHSSFRWALSLAAMLLLAIALGLVWRNSQPAGAIAQNPRSSPPGSSKTSVQPAGIPRKEFAEVSLLEKLPEDDDFIAVPYAPPLAPGEFIRVVRTELRPNALARMGIYVDASLSEMPADVVFGEDGFPRAVRVLGDIQF